MNYCMYLRKSRTDIEAEAHHAGDTLLRHETLLRDLANRHHVMISKIYHEIVSGETIAARPVMQKLLQEVEQGKWNGVYVMEIERLARGDTIDQGIVAQAFKYSGAKIVTPLKIYDPSNEFDEEYFEFGLFMSRREFKTINRRIQRGRIASVKEGKFISSTAPYGYQKEKLVNDKGYTLIPHPKESEVVKLIYEWYTTGYLNPSGTKERLGCMRIAALLSSMGYKSPKGGIWSKSTVLDILKNPAYIGYVRWQYRKVITKITDNRPQKYRRQNTDYLLVKGIHKPIIQDLVFQKAQEHFRNRSTPSIPGNRAMTNPLLGILYCSKCGKALTRLGKNKKNSHDLIKCMNPDCHNISSPLFLVEELLLLALDNCFRNYMSSISPIDLIPPVNQAIEGIEDCIKVIAAKIQKKEKSFEKICDYLEEGIYSKEDYLKRKIKLQSDMDELNKSQQLLYEELKQLRINKENHMQFPEIKSLSNLYYTLTTAQSNNTLLKALVERVEYRKDSKNRKGDLLRSNFTLDIYQRLLL